MPVTYAQVFHKNKICMCMSCIWRERKKEKYKANVNMLTFLDNLGKWYTEIL